MVAKHRKIGFGARDRIVVSGVIFALCSFGAIETQHFNAEVCDSRAHDDIQKCMNPISRFTDGLNVTSTDKPTLPSLPPHIFEELCTRVDDFFVCSGKVKGCPNHVTVTLIDASYGYLCKDGKALYLENSDCLTKLDYDPEVRICHNDVMKLIKNASMDGHLKFQHMCTTLEKFGVCVNELIYNKCGTNAWALIARVIRDTMRAISSDCVFSLTIPELISTTTTTTRPRTGRPRPSQNSGTPSANNQYDVNRQESSSQAAPTAARSNMQNGKNPTNSALSNPTLSWVQYMVLALCFVYATATVHWTQASGIC